ncbi:MAG: DUF4384 domain-containing protein, partial [Alphaproteobacteria bacterium]
DALLAADAARFRNAMVAAGLDPDLLANGVEMINALAKRYENALGLRLGAAEFGQTADEFTAATVGVGQPDVVRLHKRLQQNVIPRDTFEEQYIELVEYVSDQIIVDLGQLAAYAIPVASVGRPLAVARDFDLTLISSYPSYVVGDEVVFTVRSAQNCYLQLVNIDGRGQATVIFPNQFQRDNFLPAGRDLDFPAADAPFLFRFADPGIETVIATCSLQDRPVDGVKIDYGQVFTDLGNYEQHVSQTRSIVVEQQQASAAVLSPSAPPVLTSEGIIARTAIRMEVR